MRDKKWVNTQFESIVVPSLTLNDFCKEKEIIQIDLLKINCEGGEYEIFTPGAKEFLERVNVIDLVLHGKHPTFLSSG